MAKHVPIASSFDFGDDAVAAGFDKHVREQLPWYEMTTNAVVQIARHYIPERGLVYDIGAANGNIGRALEPLLTERHAALINVEPSLAMADKFDAPGSLLTERAENVDYRPYDFAVSMLALIFVRPSEIPDLLDQLVSKIRPGGALVVVERMLPPDGYPSIVSSRLTLAAKREAGATAEEIIAKELSLAGVQRPLSRKLLESLGAVEWFRYGDFAGWLIEHQPSKPTYSWTNATPTHVSLWSAKDNGDD